MLSGKGQTNDGHDTGRRRNQMPDGQPDNMAHDAKGRDTESSCPVSVSRRTRLCAPGLRTTNCQAFSGSIEKNIPPNKQPGASPSVDSMRILFCTHDIDSGGSGRSLSILLEHLAKRHTVSLLSLIPPSPDKARAARYRELGIPLSVFPWGWLPVDFVGCPVDAAAQKKRSAQLRDFIPQVKRLSESADAICFNGYPSASLASVFPSSVPKYLIAREVLQEESPGFPSVAAFLRSRISRAIAIGPVEADQLERMGVPCSLVFNTGSTTPEFTPLPPLSPLRFGAFGQFVPCKGMDTLALATEIAAPELRRHNATVYVFGGTGNPALSPLEEPVRNFLCQKNLEDVMRLEGWTNNVETHMKTMHCIVRPDATGSPWGRDIIEAMSLGRPVLATGSENVFIREGHTGWLVAPGDAQALARALAGLARAPSLLGRMAKNAFDFARENFDPETNAERIERILAGG